MISFDLMLYIFVHQSYYLGIEEEALLCKISYSCMYFSFHDHFPSVYTLVGEGGINSGKHA